MKPKLILRCIRDWLPPQTWGQAFTAIIILVLVFLAVIFGLAYLKAALL